LANFVQSAHRGLPLLTPPSPAERAYPGAPARPAASYDILPLSMVAVTGRRTGTAAMLVFAAQPLAAPERC
jgi:hypothetical protein